MGGSRPATSGGESEAASYELGGRASVRVLAAARPRGGPGFDRLATASAFGLAEVLSRDASVAE